MPCLGDRGCSVTMAISGKPLAMGSLSAALHSTGDMVLEDCVCALGDLSPSHVAETLGENLWAGGQIGEGYTPANLTSLDCL